jgi:hypothetical protein
MEKKIKLTFELSDLESLRDCNELDLLYKIIDLANKSKQRTEDLVKGNKSAGVDIRKAMQSIKMLSEIIRDNTQVRRGVKNKKEKLEEYIEREKARIKREENKIQKLQEKRMAQIRGNGR